MSQLIFIEQAAQIRQTLSDRAHTDSNELIRSINTLWQAKQALKPDRSYELPHYLPPDQS